jgi:hypothetical protein
MNMTHRLAVSTAIAGLCSCHTTQPLTEELHDTKQLERIDCSLLHDDSLFVMMDNPEIYVIDTSDTTAPPALRVVSVKAKSLQLRHGTSGEHHVETVTLRQDSTITKTTQAVPIKRKSTTATRAAALLTCLTLLIFLGYKYRHKC